MGEGDNIQLIKADVNKSAAEIEAAANHVAGIDIAGPFGELAKAMPGSMSAGAAKTASAALEKDRDAWVKQAHAHHTQTVADASKIHKTDDMIGDAANKSTSSPDSVMNRRIAARLGDF